MQRSLPASPDLDKLRRAAKALLRAVRARNPEAVARLREHLTGPVTVETAALHDAHTVVAREYGFRSWRELKSQVLLGTPDGHGSLGIVAVGEDAIQIGTVELHTNATVRITAAARFPFPTPGNSESTFRAHRLVTAVKMALADGILPALTRTVLCLPGSMTFVRFVKIPGRGGTRTELAAEAAAQIPFPFAEIFWDCLRISRSGNTTTTMHVCVCNNFVAPLLDALQRCDVQPVRIDTTPAALLSLVHGINNGRTSSAPTAALLHLETTTCHLAVHDGRHPFVRIIPINRSNDTPLTHTNLDHLANELDRSFAVIEKMSGSQRPGRLLVSGSPTAITELRTPLVHRLGLACEALERVPGVRTPENSAPIAEPWTAPLLGTALAEAAERGIRLDLRPAEA